MRQKTCPTCKLRIDGNRNVCPNCGESLPTLASEETIQPDHLRPVGGVANYGWITTKKILLLALALTTIIGIIIYCNNAVVCMTIKAIVSPKYQAILGLYYEGNNQEKSTYYLEKGAKGGDATAQLELGCMYAEGQGVPKDFYESVRLLEQSAMQGHPRAAVCMGDSYESGEGVPRDYCEAFAWYLVAKAEGYDLRMSWYDRLPALSEGVKAESALRAQHLLYQIQKSN